MQPYMFPYLGYFQLAASVDEFWLFDCVQYIRRGWMNRNFLCVNGEPRRFTLSVEKGHQGDLISEKKFSAQLPDDIENLQKIAWRAYADEPFWDDLHGILEKHKRLSLSNTPMYFSAFSHDSLKSLFSHLDIKTPLFRTSELRISASFRAQDRIVEVCKQVGAQRYINPYGGRDLYDAAVFQRSGISLGYLKPDPNSYLPAELRRGPAGSYSVLDFIARIKPLDYISFLETYELEWAIPENGHIIQ
ncbi:hypothetical protein MACH10_20500 [Thalassospira tepidiphila]|nr:hypothetical protein MACH10_20500 [Thalassospira tepidiphila]